MESDLVFGQLISSARRAAGLTQQQLAKLAGISKAYVGTIENARQHNITGAISRPERDVAINLINAVNSHLTDDLKLEMESTLNWLGYSPPKKETIPVPNLPDGLVLLDFDGLDSDDIEEIKALIKIKQDRKKRKSEKNTNEIPF